MNREHYQQVLDRITAHPDEWRQATWHCGTQHCFAGWAQLLAGHPANDETARRDARIFLDLSYHEANWLFAPSTSIEDFRSFLNDRDGYDRAGYKRAGYDLAGYDRDGYDREGYDRAGYKRDGYDRDGLDVNNRPKEAS